MTEALQATLEEAARHAIGYIYPNEAELQWSILIVLYPYLTGLVAGAFILASLKRLFNVSALAPIYRLALLTALAYLLVAPLPLLAHLGHPERNMEVVFTPHLSSPMAMFGFVYAWYLMAVLLLEIWYDYRADIVRMAHESKGMKARLYSFLTLGVKDVSQAALEVDDKAGRTLTIVGIPSAFLLHGYVGFIFGSIKANPWWGTVLMPVIFLFSAIVSGMAAVLVLYMLISYFREKPVDLACLDSLGTFLFYALVLDFSIESLDWMHRLYEANESIDILKMLASGKLGFSLGVVQIFFGTLVPLAALVTTQFLEVPKQLRKFIYFGSACLILVGIFAVRWNVVIGGQLFSKSLAGFTFYKPELIGREGVLVAALFLMLPLVILWALAKILPPWEET